MVKNLYFLLPDFSGIFLAALGAAMVFAPDWVNRLNKKIRWALASFLILCGGLGMRSSFVQHRDADRAQAALKDQVNELTSNVGVMSNKLDKIINDPTSSAEQRNKAQILKREIQQSSKNSPCSNVIAGGSANINCSSPGGNSGH